MRRRGANFLRKSGAPGAIPTRDLPLRRRTLYAAELREHEARLNRNALWVKFTNDVLNLLVTYVHS